MPLMQAGHKAMLMLNTLVQVQPRLRVRHWLLTARSFFTSSIVRSLANTPVGNACDGWHGSLSLLWALRLARRERINREGAWAGTAATAIAPATWVL